VLLPEGPRPVLLPEGPRPVLLPEGPRPVLLPEGPRPVLLPDSREKPLGAWKEVGRCVMWRARPVLTMCCEGQGGTQETAGLHPAVDPDVVRRGAGQGYAWGEGQRARARAIGSKAV
jgi:hypothetical protein